MDNVEQLNVKRVQKYMRGLPEDENSNLIVDEADLENIKRMLFSDTTGKIINHFCR